MISGATPATKIWFGTGMFNYGQLATSIEIVRGGAQFGPYRGGPDVGTATVNLYYPASNPANLSNFAPGTKLTIGTRDAFGVLTQSLFYGPIQDYTVSYIPEASGEFGQSITIYMTDQVGAIQQVEIPGIVTSSTTKNVSWETRINTLGASIPNGAYSIPTTPEAHVYRLVDNNVDSTLAEQLDLACNSVGATWYVDRTNAFVTRKLGDYPKTGCLFTDDPTYWNAGNKPANAGSTIYYNLTYKDIEYGSDTANIANVVNMTNIMPRNMVTRASGGALVYKDPATIPGPLLPVLEQPYTAEDATSITSYGRRQRDLVTNVYPYRTTDTDSYYLRFNGYNDPGAEYQTTPELFVLGNVCNATTSTANPKSGTYCWNLTTTALVDGFRVKLGPDGGYPMKVKPTANTNPFLVSIRVPVSTARYTRGIEYYDNNGNIVLTQLGTQITPSVGVYSTNSTVFMNFATIPTSAVSWRPIINVAHQTPGTNFAIGTIFKFDEVSVNPDMDTASYFSGDNADTATDLYSWESTPGESWSYLTRNILDNIGTDVITYWALAKSSIRYLSWNVRQNWDAAAGIEVGGRIDVRYNGTSYTAWISRLQYSITPEDIIVKLYLSSRPNSWI